MDLCLCNLEEYIKMRKDNLSIEEIREILIQLNESLKLMIKEDIIYRDLKPQNILINLEKINEKCVIQLSGFVSCLINNINKREYYSQYIDYNQNLKSNKFLSENIISNLRSLIYYMLYKEYSYF